MPTIEVFLMFKPTDRNSQTKDKKKTIEPGPSWKSIDVELRKNGYTLIVHGPDFHPSVQQIQDSMRNAEVTILVGHGASMVNSAKFISDHIDLSDGVIVSPTGVLVAKPNANGGPAQRTPIGKLQINKITGVFTCNSTDKMPDAFDLPPGSHLVTNDGGAEGLTRIGTLELGAAEFVRWYGLTKGDPKRAMSHAQSVFTEKGKVWPRDKGDKLSDKIGTAPPLPERCEVKDW